MRKDKNLEIRRHSCAHVLAQAVLEMFPEAKLGIGPATKDGFYYDFDLPRTLIPEDLEILEKKMQKIIKENLPFKKETVDRQKAIEFMKKINQTYKVELLKEMRNKKVTFYRHGKFLDLCTGPHLKSTGQIGAFKLLSIAGAYWKGDEKKPMLQRIYGTCFASQKELNQYLKMKEEAEKRDHRLWGKRLEIFTFDQEVGAGLPIWLPRGVLLRKIIENYLRQELDNQRYQWLITPHIGHLNLWKTSGHWNLYRENIYSPINIEGEKYLLKPMNCPFHVKFYNLKIRSYKELPFYLAEMGTVYRYEKSGTLHGLTRVRGFTQDDAHIICRPDQIEKEVTKLLKHGLRILKNFGFKNYTIYLSTQPEKYAGQEKDWRRATNALKSVLKKLNLSFQIDPGGGVFYGPKIDIKIKDALEREWQCTTIQFDFNLPERFKMTYIDKKGKEQKPYMIHRALLGSVERFIGVLLEHYAGALPLWLSPIQIQIIPVSDKFLSYAKKINQQFLEENLRSEVNEKDESVGKKIREAEMQKIPYIIVIGEKELKNRNRIMVRASNKKELMKTSLKKFIKKAKQEIEKKK